ncbi:unnamed protein product, partial [Vitis vinifera]|uniref:Uncharacterized protein n=1 Tax=Vitis vinifera TaxID=29760 RepID=D7SLI6_VITVI
MALVTANSFLRLPQMVLRFTHSRKHVQLFIQVLCRMELSGFGQTLILNSKIFLQRKSLLTSQNWMTPHIPSPWELDIFHSGTRF